MKTWQKKNIVYYQKGVDIGTETEQAIVISLLQGGVQQHSHFKDFKESFQASATPWCTTEEVVIAQLFCLSNTLYSSEIC